MPASSELYRSPSPPAFEESWRGASALKYWFVFGDSLSSLGYNFKQPYPIPTEPLGIDFPGLTHHGGPNWVAFVARPDTEIPPSGSTPPPSPRRHKRRISQLLELFKARTAPKPADAPSKTMIFDYAISGARVESVANQIRCQFLPYAAAKPTWADWQDHNSLFVTWVGTNDVYNKNDIQTSLASLFEAQEELYDSGARNFLFVTVPPFYRSPVFRPKRFFHSPPSPCFSLPSSDTSSTDEPPPPPPVVAPSPKAIEFQADTATWNATLRTCMASFREKHPDAKVMLYDAWALFTKLLDEPKAFGFEDMESRGDFWFDAGHPTSKVHSYLAKDMLQFLATI